MFGLSLHHHQIAVRLLLNRAQGSEDIAADAPSRMSRWRPAFAYRRPRLRKSVKKTESPPCRTTVIACDMCIGVNQTG